MTDIITILSLVFAGLGQSSDPPPSPLAPPATTTAFVGVRVIPMRAREKQPVLLADQTVVIREGRIAAVGPRDDVPVPGEAVVIDGQGLYLMPGLADMHVHLWNDDEFILNLANGVTAVRNMWGSDLHLEWQRRIEAGELLGPTIYTTGPLMDGKPPIWPTSLVIEDLDTARNQVREQARAGYGALKVYNRLRRPIYDAIVETARQVGLPVVGHTPDAVGLRHVLESGQHSIEHLTGYLEFCRGGAASNGSGPSGGMTGPRSSGPIDPARIAEATRLTLEAGTWNCVTLIVMQRWVAPAEAQRFLDEPEMRYVSPETKASWNPQTDFRKQRASDAYYAAVRKDNEARMAITRALHAAGARILLGTDTPNPYVVPGFGVPRELENLVAAGLSPYEALRAGTCDAAEFLGESREFGTVAPGRRADLIALHADPIADIGNVRQIAGVMVRGRWLGEGELRGRLETLATGYERRAEWSDDPFAGVAPLPEAGEEIAGGAYVMGPGEVVQAAERFSRRRDPDGVEMIHAQFVYPASRLVTTLRYETGEDGFGESMAWETTSAMGREAGELVRDGDRLEITRQVGERENQEEREIDEAALLWAPFVGIEALLLPFADGLTPGQQTEIPIVAVDFSPDLRVHQGSLQFARLEDGTRPGASGEAEPVRVYRAEEIGPEGKPVPAGVRVSLVVDSRGRVLERTTDTARGPWTARWIERHR